LSKGLKKEKGKREEREEGVKSKVKKESKKGECLK
jgi:hypothetical protein